MDNSEKLPSLQALQKKIADEKAAVTATEQHAEREPKQQSRTWHVGTEIIGCVVVGAFLGWKAGEWMGNAPIGLIAGVLFGFSGAVIRIYRAGLKEAAGSLDENAKSDGLADDANSKGEH